MEMMPLYIGPIMVKTPHVCRYLTAGIFILTSIIILTLFGVSYSETETALGQLIQSQQTISIYAPHAGIVTKIFVKPNQSVKNGDILFLIDTTQNDPKSSSKIHFFEKQCHTLKVRITEKNKELHALKALSEKKFVSKTAVYQVEETLQQLIQEYRVAKQQQKTYKTNQQYAIYAPHHGNIASIALQVGDRCQPTQPLTVLYNESAVLIAELFVSPNQIGRLKEGDTISIQYDTLRGKDRTTYPAHITHISPTPVTYKNQNTSPFTTSYYKVTAKLASPLIKIDGHPEALHAGMTLKARFQGTKKALFFLFFNPFFTRESL